MKTKLNNEIELKKNKNKKYLLYKIYIYKFYSF